MRTSLHSITRSEKQSLAYLSWRRLRVAKALLGGRAVAREEKV